jgi:hypothetical protein
MGISVLPEGDARMADEARAALYNDLIADLEAGIKAMESGAVRVWRKRPEDGSEEDLTPNQIRLSKQSVKLLQAIIDGEVP